MTFARRGGLTDIGPMLEVQVAIPTRLRHSKWRGGLQTNPVNVSLLIDTGATITSVRTEVLQWLGLSSHERAAVMTLSTVEPHPVDAWEVDLIFDDKNSLQNLRIFGCGRLGTCDGVIGRDVLKHGIFSYEGMRKSWSLELRLPMNIIGTR